MARMSCHTCLGQQLRPLENESGTAQLGAESICRLPYARLQTIKDRIAIVGTPTSMYRQVGSAVPSCRTGLARSVRSGLAGQGPPPPLAVGSTNGGGYAGPAPESPHDGYSPEGARHCSRGDRRYRIPSGSWPASLPVGPQGPRPCGHQKPARPGLHPHPHGHRAHSRLAYTEFAVENSTNCAAFLARQVTPAARRRPPSAAHRCFLGSMKAR